MKNHFPRKFDRIFGGKVNFQKIFRFFWRKIWRRDSLLENYAKKRVMWNSMRGKHIAPMRETPWAIHGFSWNPFRGGAEENRLYSPAAGRKGFIRFAIASPCCVVKTIPRFPFAIIPIVYSTRNVHYNAFSIYIYICIHQRPQVYTPFITANMGIVTDKIQLEEWTW